MIAPVLELPVIRFEGFEAMLGGMSRFISAMYPHGFCFCPYKIGSTEHANFVFGCSAAFEQRHK